ncbi:MAG: hypothetical protein LBH32_09090 [Dysgonamonadaceae bacterium]|jgi:predicted nucleotidyltransferase|nr:hypothetical protein [Dysgonamonadaceae bacterium]
MKQIEIINKMPAIFAECKDIKVALLIGSFARKQTTSKSDIDYSLWIDKKSFNPNQLCVLIKNKLPSILKIMQVDLRNKIVVYFKDSPKLEVNWYENLPEINRIFLGSEIEKVSDSIIFQQAGLEVDIEKYLKQIIV